MQQLSKHRCLPLSATPEDYLGEVVMYRNVGMTVPIPTVTRCKKGNTQAREMVQDYTNNPIPLYFI